MIVKTSHFPLTRDEFAKWLTSKGESIVGVARIGGECPLAQCLQEKMGASEILVSQDSVYIGRSCDDLDEYPLPAWAVSFVREVDGTFEKGEPLTGHQASEVLERVEGEKPKVK